MRSEIVIIYNVIKNSIRMLYDITNKHFKLGSVSSNLIYIYIFDLLHVISFDVISVRMYITSQEVSVRTYVTSLESL